MAKVFGNAAFSDSTTRPSRNAQAFTSDRASRSGKYGLKHLSPVGVSHNHFSSMITSQHPVDDGDAESQKDILMHESNGINVTSDVEVSSVYDKPCSDSTGKKYPEIYIQESR